MSLYVEETAECACVTYGHQYDGMTCGCCGEAQL